MMTIHVRFGNFVVAKDMVFGWCVTSGENRWYPITQLTEESLSQLLAALNNNATASRCLGEFETEARKQLFSLVRTREQKAATEAFSAAKCRAAEYAAEAAAAQRNYEFQKKLIDFATKTGDITCLGIKAAGHHWETSLPTFTNLLVVDGHRLKAMNTPTLVVNGVEKPMPVTSYSEYDMSTKLSSVRKNDVLLSFDTPYEWAVETMKRFW